MMRQGPTFEAVSEKSYIDITLRNARVLVKEWQITDWVTGGHKAI